MTKNRRATRCMSQLDGQTRSSCAKFPSNVRGATKWRENIVMYAHRMHFIKNVKDKCQKCKYQMF